MTNTAGVTKDTTNSTATKLVLVATDKTQLQQLNSKLLFKL